jgi:hypothetical protein
MKRINCWDVRDEFLYIVKHIRESDYNIVMKITTWYCSLWRISQMILVAEIRIAKCISLWKSFLGKSGNKNRSNGNQRKIQLEIETKQYQK